MSKLKLLKEIWNNARLEICDDTTGFIYNDLDMRNLDKNLFSSELIDELKSLDDYMGEYYIENDEILVDVSEDYSDDCDNQFRVENFVYRFFENYQDELELKDDINIKVRIEKK